MKEHYILPPPPPNSVESPTLSALAELFYFRSNLITQHITHINHHLSACHSTAPPAVESLHLIKLCLPPPATAIEGFLARQRNK